jgi:hypothetical protein
MTAAAACLVLATGACQLDVGLSTAVRRDGSGRLSIQFVLDKELVDIARNLSGDPLSALTTLPPELTRSGWTVRRDSGGGGLAITVERPFSSPGDLNKAIGDLRASLASRREPAARFFDVRVERSSSFFRSATSVTGTIDLTGTGLLGRSSLSPETRRRLQSLLDPSSNQFFRFTLTVELPGGVSSTAGDPQRVKGGTVEWAPQLGTVLSFKAATSSYNASLGVIGGGIAVMATLLVAGLARRRRVRGAATEIGASPASAS